MPERGVLVVGSTRGASTCLRNPPCGVSRTCVLVLERVEPCFENVIVKHWKLSTIMGIYLKADKLNGDH